MRLRALVFLLLVVPASLAGQEQGTAITGTVLDSVSQKTLRDALVYFTSGGAEARTDRSGKFRLERRTPADTMLVVRTVGYVPAYLRVPVSSSAAAVDVGRVAVGPVATRLDRIAVEAEEVRIYPHLEDFYRRKQLGLAGDFITREDIEKMGARETSSIVSRSTPKVSMDCPNDPVRAAVPECIARDRRGERASYGLFKNPNGSSGPCDKQLFVDGRRFVGAIDDIPADDVAAVEIYAGPATTPANFGAPPCGVVAIWTLGTNR